MSEFKYRIEQVVHYWKEGRPHSAPILSRMKIENGVEKMLGTEEQKRIFNRFGSNTVRYSTIHGEYEEHELFPSYTDLMWERN